MPAVLPLPFAYPYAIVFWTLFVAVFAREFLLVRRAQRRPRSEQDRGSMRLIMIGNSVGLTAALGLAFWQAQTIAAHRQTLFWTGLILIAAGAGLRRHCFRVLGASFKAAVDVGPDQVVVERGAYRFVRHPSYAAAVLLFVGIGLALTNWASLFVLVVMVAIVYGYRIHVEEAALAQSLGDAYRGYMARTKRIVPFLW